MRVRDWKNRIERLARDERGQDLVEYALLAAFIAIISVAVLRTLGQTVATFFGTVDAAFQ